MNPNQIGVSKAAACLHVNPETVRRYIREQKLVAQKVAVQGLKTEWSINVQELKNFAKRQKVALDLGALNS